MYLSKSSALNFTHHHLFFLIVTLIVRFVFVYPTPGLNSRLVSSIYPAHVCFHGTHCITLVGYRSSTFDRRPLSLACGVLALLERSCLALGISHIEDAEQDMPVSPVANPPHNLVSYSPRVLFRNTDSPRPCAVHIRPGEHHSTPIYFWSVRDILGACMVLMVYLA